MSVGKVFGWGGVCPCQLHSLLETTPSTLSERGQCVRRKVELCLNHSPPLPRIENKKRAGGMQQVDKSNTALMVGGGGMIAAVRSDINDKNRPGQGWLDIFFLLSLALQVSWGWEGQELWPSRQGRVEERAEGNARGEILVFFLSFSGGLTLSIGSTLAASNQCLTVEPLPPNGGFEEAHTHHTSFFFFSLQWCQARVR